jgi:hypothetical protein
VAKAEYDIVDGYRDYVTKTWVCPNGRHLRLTEIYSVMHHQIKSGVAAWGKLKLRHALKRGVIMPSRLMRPSRPPRWRPHRAAPHSYVHQRMFTGTPSAGQCACIENFAPIHKRFLQIVSCAVLGVFLCVCVSVFTRAQKLVCALLVLPTRPPVSNSLPTRGSWRLCVRASLCGYHSQCQLFCTAQKPTYPARAMNASRAGRATASAS